MAGEGDDPPLTARENRIKRHEEGRAAARPQEIIDYLLGAAQRDARRAREAVAGGGSVAFKAEVERALHAHACVAHGVISEPPRVLVYDKVKVVTMSTAFDVQFPVSCSCCHPGCKLQHAALPPLLIGFYPANVTWSRASNGFANVLFDTSLLEHMQSSVGRVSEMSMEGACVSQPWTRLARARNHAARCCPPQPTRRTTGPQLVPRTVTGSYGALSSATTGARPRACAACNHAADTRHRVATGAMEPAKLGVPGAPDPRKQPSAHCPVCAPNGEPDSPAPGGLAAPPGKALVYGCCMDACAKCIHYTAAGRGDTTEPALHLFAGDANDKVVASEAPGAPLPPRLEVEAECCDSVLRCANASAAKAKDLDVKNVFCACCRHGVVLCGSVAYSNRAETFYPYHLILAYILSLIFTPYILFDNNCRFSIGFRKAFSFLGAHMPEMFVGWMHAMGHTESCRLKFSGLFQTGLGRTVGETMETVWSKFRNWGVTSKMTRADLHDFLETVLYNINMDIRSRFPEMLFKSWCVLLDKLEAGTTKLAAIVRSAAACGVTEAQLAAGAAQFAASTMAGTTAVPEPNDVLLVRQLILARVGISPETALVLALIHGRGLAPKSEEARRKAATAAESLMFACHVDAYDMDGEWSPTGAKYLAAAETLAASLLRQAQDSVDDALLMLKSARTTNGRDGCVPPCIFCCIRARFTRLPSPLCAQLHQAGACSGGARVEERGGVQQGCGRICAALHRPAAAGNAERRGGALGCVGGGWRGDAPQPVPAVSLCQG